MRRHTSHIPYLIPLTVAVVFSGMSSIAHASLANITPGYFDSNLTSGLIGWWTLDGADMDWENGRAIDRSGNAVNGVLRGMSTSSSAVVGRLGQAIKFDGVDDCIDMGNVAAYNFSDTQSFSMSLWFNVPDNINSQAIAGKKGSAISAVAGFNVLVAGNGTVESRLSDSITQVQVNSSTGYDDDKWHNLVMVVDRATDQFNTYVDTAASSPGDISSVGSPNNAVSFLISGRSSAGSCSSVFPARADDVRVYDRALSTLEISQLYNEGATKHNITPSVFPSPLKSGLTGWWTMDGADTNWATGREVDKSGNGFTGTLNGFSTSTSPTPGKIGQALSFNGSASHITTSNALSSFMSNATGTMSAWFYAKAGNTTGCSDGNMSALVTDGTATGGYVWLGYDGTNLCAGGFDGAARSLSTAVSTGQWVHAVWVHQNGVLTLWKNALLAGSTALGNIADLAQPIHIGRSFSNAYFSGYIDDVRTYSTALSTTTIQQLYDFGAATRANLSLNMPGSSLQNGLVGWWTFDGKNLINNAADSSGQGYTGYLSGFTSTTTAPGRLGQALSFSGAGSQSVIVGTAYNGVQTVSFWVKPNTTTQKIIDLNGTASIELVSGTVTANSFTDPTRYVDGLVSSTVGNTGWHHVVVTTGTAINASALVIGAIASAYYTGIIDDVRIYSRVLSASEVQRLYNTGR